VIDGRVGDGVGDGHHGLAVGVGDDGTEAERRLTNERAVTYRTECKVQCYH